MMAYTERLSSAGKLRGSVFGLQVYERVELSLVEVYERRKGRKICHFGL